MSMNENIVTQNLDDREILDDVLSSQKQITASYNTFGNECTNEQLRTDFLNILRDEHNMQSGVFTQMQSRHKSNGHRLNRYKTNARMKQLPMIQHKNVSWEAVCFFILFSLTDWNFFIVYGKIHYLLL